MGTTIAEAEWKGLGGKTEKGIEVKGFFEKVKNAGGKATATKGIAYEVHIPNADFEASAEANAIAEVNYKGINLSAMVIAHIGAKYGVKIMDVPVSIEVSADAKVYAEAKLGYKGLSLKAGATVSAEAHAKV